MRGKHWKTAAVTAPALMLALAFGACSKPPAPEPQERELVTEEVYESAVDLSEDVSEVAPVEMDLEGMGLVLPPEEVEEVKEVEGAKDDS